MILVYGNAVNYCRHSLLGLKLRVGVLNGLEILDSIVGNLHLSSLLSSSLLASEE